VRGGSLLGSNERLLELSSSRPKGKFDANAGIKLFWSKTKFVAYPEATVCRHESHVLVMSYYGIKLDTEEAAQFMRIYFRQIVKGLNVRRNNSARGLGSCSLVSGIVSCCSSVW
jgi:hypothetical protein